MKKTILLVLILMSTGFVTDAQTLHIYGGEDHDEYLGCLTCNALDANSIWNEYGKYGNKYNANSIWNAYGKYGNEYNAASPWAMYGGDPPVVVDKQGNFYGYLTRNSSKPKRADFELALLVYEYYDDIRDDVSGWYKKVFE